jgi:predicted RNase H-like nuclease (RuvC/YqgF family)
MGPLLFSSCISIAGSLLEPIRHTFTPAHTREISGQGPGPPIMASVQDPLIPDQLASSTEADEIKKLQDALAQTSSVESDLKQEVENLKAALAQAASTESKLKDDIESLKTALTHAFSSEQQMRASARATREEWEQMEKELRHENLALKNELEKTSKQLKRTQRELKGKRLVPFMRRFLQERGRLVEVITHEETPPGAHEEVQVDNE